MNFMEFASDLAIRQATQIEGRRIEMISIGGKSELPNLDNDETFLVAQETPFVFIGDYSSKKDCGFFRAFNMLLRAFYLHFKGKLEQVDPKMRVAYAEAPERFKTLLTNSFDAACSAIDLNIDRGTRDDAVESEIANVAVLCSFAERKVIRYCIRRIIEPGVNSCYLYVELEGDVNPKDFYDEWSAKNPDLVKKYA